MVFNLFKDKEKAAPKQEEAVIIHLDAVSLPDEIYQQYDLITLEEKIREVLEKQNLGEYDGDESGPGVTKIYLYGPDAEKMFSSLKPVLKNYPLCKNSKVLIRRGGPGATQREEILS